MCILSPAIAEIASATLDNYHKSRSFLEQCRFYLNAEQCRIVNESLDRIERKPREVGQIVIITERFEPHPAMNDSYLSDDTNSSLG